MNVNEGWEINITLDNPKSVDGPTVLGNYDLPRMHCKVLGVQTTM